MPTMNSRAYLDRIGYSGPTGPTVPALFALQRAHLLSVPFENLDIPLGRKISLNEEDLFNKIVTHRRGGFCYELNGLFARLLSTLGYQVILLNARAVKDDGSFGLEFDHLALEVTAPDDPTTPWLVDVGWGNGPLEPLRLADPDPQPQGERLFRLDQAGDYHILTEFIPADDVEKGLAEDGAGAREARWIKCYAFTLRPQRYEDFFEGCRYHTTSPDSFFTRKRLCSLFTPDGRVTVSDLRLIVTTHHTRVEREIASELEFLALLKAQFQIDLYP